MAQLQPQLVVVFTVIVVTVVTGVAVTVFVVVVVLIVVLALDVVVHVVVIVVVHPRNLPYKVCDNYQFCGKTSVTKTKVFRTNITQKVMTR